MASKRSIQTQEELRAIQEASQRQALPDHRRVFSVSEKIRRRAHNLPDPTRPPLGYDEHKAFDRVFPYVRLPQLHPLNHGDTVIFNAPELSANQLILGDNLEVLRTLPPECIDLIYIDPPFFSGRTYNVIWGDTNEVRTFYDIWEGGIDSYLIWLNARLWEMKRVLKKTGSIYVHCDWHASHYIKCEMDKIFGYDNFLNEIAWQYEGPQSPSPIKFASKHDVIFRYAKALKFAKAAELYYTEFISEDEANYKLDEQGRYFYTLPKGDYTEESLRELEREGRLHRTKSGKIRIKYFVEKGEGGRFLRRKKLPDVWSDIPSLGLAAQAREVIGYPTQKPEGLLERIIKASSNEGDVVADFFVGGGTACAVAMKLNRCFIGCDSSRVAVEEADFFLRFPAPPVIGDIRIKNIGPLEYEFEAVDAMSTNEDGWLVNCQWDFDYHEGHFSANKDYILSRQKVKSKVRGADERFEAILTARHKFEKPGTYPVACKVQDNLAGETIFAKTVQVIGS